MGFKSDFKMLIQNGFTRKYIFISTMAVMSFMSIVGSVIDTLLAKTIIKDLQQFIRGTIWK